MSAGFQITKADIDNTSGQIARSIFTDLGNAQKFKAWLDAYSVADLTVNWAIPTADGNILKSAFTDLDDLAKVFNNTTSAYLTGTHDYRAFARQLLGVGMY